MCSVSMMWGGGGYAFCSVSMMWGGVGYMFCQHDMGWCWVCVLSACGVVFGMHFVLSA